MKIKRNVMVSGTFILFIILACTSCKENYPKQISELDSVHVLLEDAQTLVKKIDTTQIQSHYLEIIYNLSFIQKFNTDTINKEVGLMLSDYASLKDVFFKFPKTREKILMELDYSKNQIKNLIHDIEHSTIDKENVGNYFYEELLASTQIIKSTYSIVNNLNQSIKQFEEINPKVKDFVTSIEETRKVQ